MSQANKVVQLRVRKQTGPILVNGKVPPPRRKNSEVRSREYLTSAEVDKLIAGARRLAVTAIGTQRSFWWRTGMV